MIFPLALLLLAKGSEIVFPPVDFAGGTLQTGVATQSGAVDPAPFRIIFADGRNALEHGFSGSRLRKDITINESSVNVHFTANETAFDLELQLLSSIYTDNAANMLDGEPAAYGDGNAVITLGSDGYVAGTIWESEGIISVHRDAGQVELLVEMHSWAEQVNISCGVQTDEPQANGTTVDTTTAGSSDGSRRNRAYDQWWRNPTECYTNDEVTTAAHMGIAVGYNAWVKWGETEQRVAEAIATIVQTTNVIVRRKNYPQTTLFSVPIPSAYCTAKDYATTWLSTERAAAPLVKFVLRQVNSPRK